MMADCGSMPLTFDRSRTPPIPDGTRPLQHQVAGHIFGRPNGHKRNNKIGFLQSVDGAVLKPVQAGGKGERELDFYRELFSADMTDASRIELRKYVAKYLGVWTTPLHPGQKYLKLEDVTCQFQHPCVMDIKIGPVTYDHEADAAKIAREKAKSPALEEVGFQLVGIKLYDPVKHAYFTFERNFLRSLSKETVLTKGLATYFCADDHFDIRLVEAFQRRLAAIESWFQRQTSLRFIASSLLFIYEADAVRLLTNAQHKLVHGTAVNGEKLNNNLSRPHSSEDKSSSSYLNGFSVPTYGSDRNGVNGKYSGNGKIGETDDIESCFDRLVDIRMIDFTHVFPTVETDSNYLTGLRSLRSYLSRLSSVGRDVSA